MLSSESIAHNCNDVCITDMGKEWRYATWCDIITAVSIDWIEFCYTYSRHCCVVVVEMPPLLQKHQERKLAGYKSPTNY